MTKISNLRLSQSKLTLILHWFYVLSSLTEIRRKLVPSWREDDYGWSFLLAQKHHLVLRLPFLPQLLSSSLAAWCHHLNDIFKRCWLYVFSTKGLKKNHQDCRDLVRGLFHGSKKKFFFNCLNYTNALQTKVSITKNSDFSNRRKLSTFITRFSY